MTLQTICSIDLQALSKRDLKALCQAARDEWGQPIDLRSGAAAMIAYLEAYKRAIDQELAKVEEVTPEPDVTTPNIEETTTVTTLSLPIELFDGIDTHPMIDEEGQRYLATPFSCDIGEWLDALRQEELEEQAFWADPERDLVNEKARKLSEYWNSSTRTYNKAVSSMKATRLGELLQEEYDQECREWWANWEQKYQESIATMKAKTEPLSTSICVTENDAPASPVIVGLCILTVIALIAELLSSAAVWVVKQIQQRELMERSFAAAVAQGSGNHRAKAKGFAKA